MEGIFGGNNSALGWTKKITLFCPPNNFGCTPENRLLKPCYTSPYLYHFDLMKIIILEYDKIIS